MVSSGTTDFGKQWFAVNARTCHNGLGLAKKSMQGA